MCIHFFQQTSNVDDRTLSNASWIINEKFKVSNKQKLGFFEVRDKINCYVKTCANNVKVVIYIDEQSIEFIAGDAENHLIFYIKSDGSIEAQWIKVSWKVSLDIVYYKGLVYFVVFYSFPCVGNAEHTIGRILFYERDKLFSF